MSSDGPAPLDRVLERRRAVALARHFREAEGLSIAEITQRLGCSSASVKAYFYDPTGQKARAVKARYQGVCRGCGAYTQPHNGKGDAYAYCKRCHPGVIQLHWTHERVLAAMRNWRDRYGRLPSSYDWSRTHAAGAAAKRSSGSARDNARRRASSATASEAGRLSTPRPNRTRICSGATSARGRKGPHFRKLGRAVRSTSEGKSRRAGNKFAQRAWSSRREAAPCSTRLGCRRIKGRWQPRVCPRTS